MIKSVLFASSCIASYSPNRNSKDNFSTEETGTIFQRTTTVPAELPANRTQEVRAGSRRVCLIS